ncbi:MAG: TolC family protein [Rikenellaceae bacterium]|nr:TolC family protein [Rikenellaceae bacterium]
MKPSGIVLRCLSAALLVFGLPTFAAGEGDERSVVAVDGIIQGKEDEASGDGVVPLSLAECLRIGFEENFDIRIERNEAKITDNNAKRTNAGYYPSVDIGASYSGSVNHLKQENNSAYNGYHNGTLNIGPSVAWTVFDGFSVRTTYERLREFQTLGHLSLRATIEEFIADFTSQYYSYIRQYRRLQNLRYAVSLSLDRVKMVEAQYEVGTQSRLDLQQANVDLNTDRSQLMQQYETMHNMRTLLNQLLAYPDVDRQVVAADSLILFDDSLDPILLEEEMQWNNTYLEMARTGEDISRLDLKLAQSGRYPSIRFTTGYGYTHNMYGSNGPSSYRWQRNMGLNYGVTVGFNIFDGYNQKRRERNVRLELDNSRLSYERMELALKKDFSDAWMAYRNNISLISLEQANLETAREYYEIAMERYRLGQLSGIELREAQNSLLAAEERLVQAEYDTKISEITLLYLSGGLTAYLE